jgi:replication-associated recombination protein RarA
MIRQREATQVAEALLSGQSLLVLGEPGAGKTTLAEMVRSQLADQGYQAAIASYSGSAKDLLEELADQTGVDLLTDDEKPKKKTATQLKADLLERLSTDKILLIADDAHRWSSSLRYWLEDLWRAKALLLLLAWEPPNKDIFAKLPIFKLEPLKDEEIRNIMREEAQRQGINLSISELSRLQAAAGNNPAIARRVIREAALGLSVGESNQQHYQYIDGTPILLALLCCIGVVRFVGIGMGDKAIYIIGGILTLLTLAVRAILYAANRGGRKL